jgi:hypothetical protein
MPDHVLASLAIAIEALNLCSLGEITQPLSVTTPPRAGSEMLSLPVST